MFLGVVDQVAALAERLEVGGMAVARVMVEVGTREHDIGDLDSRQDEALLDSNASATVGSPALCICIPPATIPEMGDAGEMRSPALLALAPCPLEAHGYRDLRPIDRVKPAVFGSDRHPDSMSQRSEERKHLFRLCPRFVAPPFRAEATNGPGSSLTARILLRNIKGTSRV